MTDQQSELDRPADQLRKQVPGAPGAATDSGNPGRVPQRSRPGWSFFFHAPECSLEPWQLGESAAWVTAYVLARLGEIPSHNLSYPQRQKIEESLDWLLATRTSHGGWTFGATGSPDDVDSTAWAVTALRHYGRPVPDAALELIRAGGARTEVLQPIQQPLIRTTFPGQARPMLPPSRYRALASIDSASSEFLAGRLRTDIERPQGRLASAFFLFNLPVNLLEDSPD